MKLAVAMSGGVDSSVVAKMMVDEGHEVVGLFLKLWSDPTSSHVAQSSAGLCGTSPTCQIKRDNRCCDYEALEDARAVANKLKIPFYVINAEKEFKKEVVDYFLEEYKNLRTPNPCIVCNDKIKFDLLLKKALQLGCEKLATGHYARIEDPGNIKYQISNIKQNPNPKSQNQNSIVIPAKAGIQANTGSQIKSGMTEEGNYRLFAGVDETKDQSYMLYRLGQDQLSKILFPLGEMTKKEVRALAVKWNLPVKEKPESQEICFVAEKDYREFLRRYLDKKYFKSGDIVDKAGKVIGHHNGLINYTIGQRKGIEQAGIKNYELGIMNENRRPLYVVGFDVLKNRLIVGEDQETYKSEMTIGNLAFINHNSQFIIHNFNLRIKIRYRHPAVPVSKITSTKSQITNPPSHKATEGHGKSQELNHKTTMKQFNNITIVFAEPQRAVTPGQSAVFYRDEDLSREASAKWEVLGGGIIES